MPKIQNFNRDITPEIYIVIVQYEERLNHKIRTLSSLLQKNFRSTVFIIQTNIENKNNRLRCINEAMEFSGYQEGLFRVLDHHKEKNLTSNNYIPIIFINDTILTGHIVRYGKILISAIIRNALWNNDIGSIFTGITSKTPKEAKAFNGSDLYISTWLFAIKAKSSTLKQFRFYNENEKFANFEALVTPKLPKTYLNLITKWLEPDDWLHGWYKAIPGFPLSSFQKSRKIMSIHLEYSLPSRLKKINIPTIDIRDISSKYHIAYISAFSLLDKFYINCIKLKYRITQKIKIKLDLLRKSPN